MGSPVAVAASELDHILRFVERILQPSEDTLNQLRHQLLHAHDAIYANGRCYNYGFVSRASNLRTMQRLRVMCNDDVTTLNQLFELNFHECVDDWDAATDILATVLLPRIRDNVAVRDTLLTTWWNCCTPALVATQIQSADELRARFKADAAALVHMFDAALAGIIVSEPLCLKHQLACSAAEQVFVALAALNADITPLPTWYALLLAYLARRVDKGMPVFRKASVAPLPDTTIEWLLDYYNYFDPPPQPGQTDAALRRLSEHWGRGYSSRRAVFSTSPSSFFCDLASFCTCVESERDTSTTSAPSPTPLPAPKADQTRHTTTKAQ